MTSLEGRMGLLMEVGRRFTTLCVADPRVRQRRRRGSIARGGAAATNAVAGTQ